MGELFVNKRGIIRLAAGKKFYPYQRDTISILLSGVIRWVSTKFLFE